MKEVFATILIRKTVLVFCLIISIFSYGQERVVNASVEVDNYGNLYVNNTITNLKQDTIILGRQLLIHKDQATLIGKVKLGRSSKYQYKPKINSFNYTANLPKVKEDSYFRSKDYFLVSIDYLATSKQDFGKKKTFNIDVKIPENLVLVHPTKKDLEQKYRFTPLILAGDFYNKKIKGFDVYNLNKHKNSKTKVEDIINVIDDAYNFYALSYQRNYTKPKIVFVPFVNKSFSGRTHENIIFLDSKILKRKISKSLLSHEVAHLFWGASGLRFKELPLTEGVTEYMSIKYLESKNEDSLLKSFLNRKHHRVEGVRDANAVTKRIKREDVSKFKYQFSPLLFLYNEKSNPNLYAILAEFYKNKVESNPTVSLNKLQEFLKEKGLKLIDNSVLPDFFITETKNEIIINGFSIKDTKIDIEKVQIDGAIETHTLSFSYNDEKYTFSKKNLQKVTIDPDYKILQFSRLNDVWHKNEASYSSKNKYFNLDDVPKKALEFSNKIIRYLESENSLILNDLVCNENVLLKDSYKALKKKIYSNTEDTITITGASTYQKKDSKYIYIKIVYFSKVENRSEVVSIKLEIDKDQRYIQRLKIY